MSKKLVVLSRSIPRHILGGMEIVTWDLSRALVKLGVDVTIITTSLPDHTSQYTDEGIHVVAIEDVPSGRYSSAWWSHTRRIFMQKYADDADAILSVSAAAYGLLPLKQQLPKVPFILQAHGTSWGEVASKWRSRQLRSLLTSVRNLAWIPKDLLAYRQFDAVVAVGARVQHDLTHPPTSWTLPADNVHLINNGIDSSLFRPSIEARRRIRERLALDNQIPIIISASRLHVQKGLGHGLKAFQRLLQDLPNAIYLIAGDGPERERLETLAHALGVMQQVHFLGTLNRIELAEWLQAADIFLFLTDHVEGLPLNVLEALATGIPAIISDHLSLFNSPALHRVQVRETQIISKIIKHLIESKKPSTESMLPTMYSLNHSSSQYLELIERLCEQQL